MQFCSKGKELNTKELSINEVDLIVQVIWGDSQCKNGMTKKGMVGTGLLRYFQFFE